MNNPQERWKRVMWGAERITIRALERRVDGATAKSLPLRRFSEAYEFGLAFLSPHSAYATLHVGLHIKTGLRP